MRLVQLAHYPVSYPGSFVPMLAAVLGEARTRGWDAEAVLGEDSRGCEWIGDLDQRGIAIRFVEIGNRARVRHEVASLLAESPAPTILHTHFTSFDVPAALAARRRRNAAVVWHLHSPARRDPVGRLRGVAKAALLGRLVDRILCVAPDRAAAAIAQGAPRGRVQFFPNAIDTAAFAAPSRVQREEARAALGLDLGAAVLLHFGWDWQRKGGDIFLRAVRALADGDRNVTALTVGAGAEAERLARELGLGDSFAAPPFGERVQTFYAAADLLASPSRAEGMPFSMLEALASGLPVAASDIPGQAVLAEGLAACRLTSLEPAALADAIASLLDRDGETATADAAAASERVRRDYDLRPWAERLLDLYEGLARSRSSS